MAHGLRKDVEDRLALLINPDSISPEGVEGVYWPVHLRGHWGTTEQGALGVILLVTKPVNELVWRITPPSALADLYNTETLEQWNFQLEVLEEHLSQGKTESPFPNSLIFGNPLPFRFPDIVTARDSLFEACTSFHHGLSKQKQIGGELDNPKPATSPILREISLRLHRALTIIGDDEHATIGRLEGLGLFGMIRDCREQTAINTGVELRNRRENDEPMTVCMVCEDLAFAKEATSKLISNLASINVNGIVAADDEEAIKAIERNALL